MEPFHEHTMTHHVESFSAIPPQILTSYEPKNTESLATCRILSGKIAQGSLIPDVAYILASLRHSLSLTKFLGGIALIAPETRTLEKVDFGRVETPVLFSPFIHGPTFTKLNLHVRE